jgi:CheY-like chemotaxis protein
VNETILVVDNELSSRTFARDALQSCGYTVLDTDEPQEALQIMRDQPVHLLVVDVVMPLMRGTELADRAQAIRPSLKVLLVSGHPTSDIGPSGRPFLAKPFTISTLANAVGDLLAPASARSKGGG